MMNRLFFLLLLNICCFPLLAEDTEPPKKYNDGPYLLFEEDSIVQYDVVEGQLKRKALANTNELVIDLDSKTKFTVSPDDGWTSVDATKYSTDQPIVAISDIHGQYDTFEKILISNKVIDTDLKWAFGQGHLVIVGDVMDRGDKVMECLWLIYHLERQAKAAGGRVHFLLGNHELMVMNGELNYLHRKYLYTSALLKTPYFKLFDRSTLLGQWLSSKNVILQINDKLFVHGGLSQQAMNLGMTIDEINEVFREKLYYKDAAIIKAIPEFATLYYNDGPLWYRGYAYPYSLNIKGIDSLFTALNINNIVVGHTSLRKIKGLYQNKVVLIDASIKLGEMGEVLHIKDDGLYVGDIEGNVTDLISEETKTTEQSSLFNYFNNYGGDIAISLSEHRNDILQNYDVNEKSTQGIFTAIIGTEQLVFSGNFKPGGKTRRKICSNYPIKIDLKKAELENFNYLPEFDKLKIVFQCNDQKIMSESIKMEKFIYDLHNVVTPYSHKARLIKAKTQDEKKYLDGLLLESREDLGLRTGIQEVKTSTISVEILDRAEYVKMVLFQYMIANTDWSARKMHNSKLYSKEDKTLITIPYDFDYAGLINNAYAVTPEILPISRVTQRYFMDKKVSLEELQKGIDYFISIENQIIDLCRTVNYLSEKSKSRSENFIAKFFENIKDPKTVKKMLKK